MIKLNDDERTRCEIWTRVMGYHRPISTFNPGKKSEQAERLLFRENAIAPPLTGEEMPFEHARSPRPSSWKTCLMPHAKLSASGWNMPIRKRQSIRF